MVFAQKIDMILRLFDGDISLSELVSLDLPSQRALVQARLDNLKHSQESFEAGKIDSYSRRYASTMSMISGGGTPSIPETSSTPNSSQIDRSKSRNISDAR